MENTEFDFDSLPIVVQYLGQINLDAWECDQWRVTIGQGKDTFSTMYHTGLGHRKVKKGAYMPNPPFRQGTMAYESWAKVNIVPVKPDNKGIMFSLLMDSSAQDYNFNDYCAEYGYENDSIKSLNIYKSCMETGENLRKVFSRDTLSRMKTALEDY